MRHKGKANTNQLDKEDNYETMKHNRHQMFKPN